MSKNVSALTLASLFFVSLFCASTAPAQSKPAFPPQSQINQSQINQSQINQSQGTQMQRLAAAREGELGTRQEPHEQLQRALVTQEVLERRSELKRDTERLVSLVAELKQHVDKTSTNILSFDVIKKAQEIQKLAKSVQDKMKNAY